MQINPEYSDLYALFDIMEIRGRFGDKVCAVTAKGKQYVRDLGNMDAERVKTDPAFEGTRRINSEFGAVASLSAIMRNGFGQMATDMAPKKAQHNKMTQHLVRNFNCWPGVRGTRTLHAARIAKEFQPYTWRANGPTTLSPNAQTWVTYAPLTQKPIVHFAFMGTPKYPQWATHIRPVFKIVALSDLKCCAVNHSYSPVFPKFHGKNRTILGPIFGLSQSIPEAANLGTWAWKPAEIFPEVTQKGMACITAVGIECLILNPDGSIQLSKFHSMQNAFCGEIDDFDRQNIGIGNRNANSVPVSPKYLRQANTRDNVPILCKPVEDIPQQAEGPIAERRTPRVSSRLYEPFLPP